MKAFVKEWFESDDEKVVRDQTRTAAAIEASASFQQAKQENDRRNREALEKAYPWPKDPRRNLEQWGYSDQCRQQDALYAILDCLLEIRTAMVKATGDGGTEA